MARLRQHAAAFAVAVASFFATATTAAYADPIFFATQSGSCDESGIPSFPVDAPHSAVGARLLLTEPSFGFWTGPWEENYFSGADVIWEDAGSIRVAADLSDYSSLDCNAGSYSLSWFDVPRAPASFSGITSANGQSDGSRIPFIASGGGPYEADVTIESGAIVIGPEEETQRTLVSSTKGYPLGELEKGQHILSIEGVEGPAARWAVTIKPKPITLSAVEIKPQTVQPGDLATLSYSLDGDAQVSIDIDGHGIHRSLVSAFATGPGVHVVRWDGRTKAGGAVPNGRYTATFKITDSYGNQTEKTATVRVKRKPPRVVCITSFSPARGSYRHKPSQCVFHKHGVYPVAGYNTVFLRHIRWRAWTSHGARGRGKYLISTVGPARATVRLMAPRRHCGQTVFTVLRVKYGRRFNGRRLHGNFRLRLDDCLE